MVYVFTWKEAGKLRYLEISEFVNKGVNAIFTSRSGGFSTGNYHSLNMGFHTGDKPELVRKNRKICCQAIGLNHRNLVVGEQIHGDRVYVVKDNDRGKGALSPDDCIPGVDALITNKKETPLISFYADCVPLFIVDPAEEVVGLAHAGWKGTVLKIGVKTIIKMKEIFGTFPRNCRVGIGPSISRDKYEVDDRVINQFKQGFNNWKQLIDSRGKGYYNLDLQLANYLSLKNIGVPADQIVVADYCTFKDEDFFYSYRRDKGKTGRMASIISL